MALLKDLPLEERGDPTKVSRYLTYMIGDKVCYGKWGEGNYVSGQPGGGYKCSSKKKKSAWKQYCWDPSVWESSTPILEQHWGLVQKGLPSSVQYCQCFVFAGVTTTIGRALGIGTRPVTNFQSAHDTKHDRSIHKFYFSTPDGVWDAVENPGSLCPNWCKTSGSAKSKGCEIESCAKEVKEGVGFGKRPECNACIPCVPCKSGHDSIWSFHVWNEMYFDRDDVKSANGWQAVDSTPQELSGGRFQMGPAPLRHVNKGEGSCYDSDFVIGEVNADIKLFTYLVADLSESSKQAAADGGAFELHEGDPLLYGIRFQNDPFDDPYNTVGYGIATKTPTGTISDACRADSTKCGDHELDVTKLYKKCPHEAKGGRECGAGFADPVPSCTGNSSLLEQRQRLQTSEVPIEIRSLNDVSQTAKHGDVVGDFSALIAPGAVHMEDPSPTTIVAEFKNSGSAARTLMVSLAITVCDNRGEKVHISDSLINVPLAGESILFKTLALPAGASAEFKTDLDLAGLDEDILSSIQSFASEETFFLQVHITAKVAETTQIIHHEPRRRLVE
jgi:hypothetical protein